MTFLDTNVFVYFVDSRDVRKQSTARMILAKALRSSDYVISDQVLNEFSNVALMKLHMTEDEAIEYIEAFAPIRIVRSGAGWTRRALQLKKSHDVQFYDSLILAAAESAGCDTILTEDLNDNQVYNGVRAVNPFKEEVAG